MQPLLIDEGLPHQVASSLHLLGLDVLAVGQAGAPPLESEDGVNIEWCASRGAVLVTNDRGRTDRIILKLLEQQRVGVLFVMKDLRAAPPHHLAGALLRAEEAMDDLVRRRARLQRILRPSGRLQPRS